MTNSNEVTIKNSDIKFSDLLDSLDPQKPHYEEISKADILILPNDSFRDYKSPLFSEDTESFFTFMKELADNNGVKAEIYMQDENYQEIELHSDEVRLPILIFQYVALPFVINMVSGYINDLMKNRNKGINFKLQSIVQKDSISKKIDYSGSVEDWVKVMETIPNEFWNDDIK